MRTFNFILTLLLVLPATFRGQQLHVESIAPDKGLNYVILDAALWDTDIDRALEENPENVPLYYLNGVDHELESVAPYLFAYADNPKEKGSFAAWLVRKYDDRHRAFYLHSDCSLEELRNHLTTFVRVKSESGNWLFFRFYDTKIAPYIFDTLTEEQAAMFFEKVNYIAYTDTHTNKEMCVGPTGRVQDYIRNNTFTKGKSLVISTDQMEAIGRAKQAYDNIEPEPATYNLPGREVSGDLPLPVYEKKSDARVKVEISVNREGKVTKASTIQQGSTLSLLVKKAAEEAALKTVFNADNDAPQTQTGNIIYQFDKITL